MMILPSNKKTKQLTRAVFESDKKRFADIARKINLRSTMLFSLGIDHLKEIKASELNFTPTSEDRVKFLHIVYQDDIDRLNNLLVSKEFKKIEFCYLFREVIKEFDRQLSDKS